MDEEGESILLEDNYYQLLNVSKTVNITSHVEIRKNYIYRNYVLYNKIIIKK